ncbi:MAG: hypothetical protein IH616_14480 [Gemmatimonadales bacterium]|jgi:P pilus assembly chaperone PapD|nr:hypothetical protein [Gemmatimonadales bacterium]
MLPRTLLRRSRTPVLVLAMLGLAPVIADAILVSPHALFITHEQRTSEIYLVNQGDEAEEVTVEFEYGYPATDSAGQITMRLIPDPPADAPSAAGWLRAFPRQARVEPGQRQRVRIRANPPADLPDGEYWSRIIVTSRGAGQPVQVAGDTAVKAGITLQLRTITSLTYRKGEVSTGIRLDDFRIEAAADSIAAWVGLTRSGNGAFLGTVLLELGDADGNVVRSWATPVAVYYSVLRRFPLETEGLAPGRYTLRFLVSTDRQDIDPRYVLPAEPIERAAEVEIR